MNRFKATLQIIGINPFVFVSGGIHKKLIAEAGKTKGHIPIHGKINGKAFQQTLVKYAGHWRLYVNLKMLKNSPKRIGEEVEIEVDFDSRDRTIEPHPKLKKALSKNIEAKAVFDNLSPSKRKEIVRYISFLKTEESVDKNVERAINFLLGNGRFVGRGKP